ncbi:hypothetical protein PAXRUDRAFT_344646 [Paxillus rubicundulus Ve08.2h10]|uniref:Unplaced genomic scaffold scaffold_189, whole genome shotgun sequence n=1 Tax=Paxillus rubicundulus Ve08.2h10 TaxID=930991 RepID=A0A0D0DS04_9AGAM|nr:hypothetical protein PAXRUDRAFT_344646 [Paxillus rubicundulus Ve08.2h10]
MMHDIWLLTRRRKVTRHRTPPSHVFHHPRKLLGVKICTAQHDFTRTGKWAPEESFRQFATRELGINFDLVAFIIQSFRYSQGGKDSGHRRVGLGKGNSRLLRQTKPATAISVPGIWKFRNPLR